MKITHEGWKELVEQLNGMGDTLLSKIEFEIWSILLERTLEEDPSVLDEVQAPPTNVVQFKKKES